MNWLDGPYANGEKGLGNDNEGSRNTGFKQPPNAVFVGSKWICPLLLAHDLSGLPGPVPGLSTAPRSRE